MDRAIASAGESPAARCRAAVHAGALFHAFRRDDALVGATEIRSLDPERGPRVIRCRDEQERVFRELVTAGVLSGPFEVDDVEVARCGPSPERGVVVIAAPLEGGPVTGKVGRFVGAP
ncbi:hypothetical protein [Nocardia aurantia]|uniref:HTH-type transcriptional repressor KstR2 C-terminal domain-containing protein n=1 Tax=Nocardia aurantia TaxID=2585199 RepID=A0A7K0DK79_9NOCA|nr:hypothetical protein [Nocardia aurantia]MQY26011.1 hypothetical protein [Nocardia aurantia]